LSTFLPLPTNVDLQAATPQQIDWLLDNGVAEETILPLLPLRCARGRKAVDGRFEPRADGHSFVAFFEAEDVVLWQPRTGDIATWNGRAFALGEAAITDAATYSFDGTLNVFADPLTWLQHKRDGIVIIEWGLTFDRLRHAPRIAVQEELTHQFRRYMRPPMPQVYVFSEERAAA